MQLNLFIQAAKAMQLHDGNYMFRSKTTGVICWFMVSSEDYDTTILETFKPGSKRYAEIDQARRLHLSLDRHGVHKQLLNQMKIERAKK